MDLGTSRTSVDSQDKLSMQNWTPILILVYATWLVGWFGLWLLVGDGFWWMVLLNRSVPYMFVPVPFLIFLAVRSRQRHLIVASLILPLVFGTLFWPYFVPRLAPSGRPNLRVMTYNVLFSNSNYEAVANVIETYDPELVALQEVQPNMMVELQERLAGEYPYSRMGAPHRYGTTAVLSRHPITDSYVLALGVDRTAVVSKIEINDTAVTFISAHLLAYGLQWVPLAEIPGAIHQRTRDQNRQARMLIEEVLKQKGIVILGCDCNSKETSSSYQILSETMSNAAREVGWRMEFPSLTGTHRDNNLNHIDFVFYRGCVRPMGVYAVQEGAGSDHRPVLAEFGNSR